MQEMSLIERGKTLVCLRDMGSIHHACRVGSIRIGKSDSSKRIVENHLVLKQLKQQQSQQKNACNDENFGAKRVLHGGFLQ